MMKCVFAGPSIHGVEARLASVDYLPPAKQGDLIEAAKRGYRIIGLIDGYFGTCASVWHKEILYALSIGCEVWGAASMGALRAAECHSFGMRPIGSIAEQYVSGALTEDADVAILHGPAEVDYIPFTEALVDVVATVDALLRAREIGEAQAEKLLAGARRSHFTERTLDNILCDFDEVETCRLAARFEACRVRQKRMDAMRLLTEMESSRTQPSSVGWVLSRSASLKHVVPAAFR